jgi:hypothetical protein
MPRDLFPAPIELGRRKTSSGSAAWALIGASVVGILGFILLMIFAFRRGGYGRGGRIGRSSGFHHRGCVVSCACACVSCACACACAGGGAAGCDRKLRHECPLCRDCESDDCRIHAGRNTATAVTGST